MSLYLPLLLALRALRDKCVCDEATSDSLTLSGDGSAVDELKALVRLLDEKGVRPGLTVDGENVSLHEIDQTLDWRVTVGKSSLVRALGLLESPGETIIIFISNDDFLTWTERQTEISSSFNWPNRLTILVDGLGTWLAGPRIRCAAIEGELPPFDTAASQHIPTPESVSSLVHIASEAMSRQVGQSALTCGDVAHVSFASLRRWAERDAALLLSSEVVSRNGVVYAILRGGRRVSLLVSGDLRAPSKTELDQIQEAASWCFAEHRDARHAILIDRLALDAKEGEPLIAFLRRSVFEALKDARDQYRLVVLEKKDAAARETREILKDVRTQADLFASKVRDLISTFLRDLLASTLLIGLGFIGRLKSDDFVSLINSVPANAFFRILAAYFVLSSLLQVAAHWRDLHLTTAELQRWWNMTRASLPGDKVRNLLQEGLSSRKWTFAIAVIVILILNGAVAFSFWNWQFFLSLLIST